LCMVQREADFVRARMEIERLTGQQEKAFLVNLGLVVSGKKTPHRETPRAVSLRFVRYTWGMCQLDLRGNDRSAVFIGHYTGAIASFCRTGSPAGKNAHRRENDSDEYAKEARSHAQHQSLEL